MGLEAGGALAAVLVSGAAGAVLQGVGRGGKAIDRLLSRAQVAAWAGARARKGSVIEPRVRDPRLSLPRPQQLPAG